METKGREVVKMERKEERKTSNLFPSHGKKKEKNPTQIQVMHKFKIPDTNLVQKQNVVCTQQEEDLKIYKFSALLHRCLS